MATLRSFILASLGLFLLTQCKPKTDNERATAIMTPSSRIQSKNVLTGEWKYVNTIWYSSELTLQENGTFNFHDQGCYGQRFSQGLWTDNDGIIELTSFDTFKLQTETKAEKPLKIEYDKIARAKSKKGTVKYIFAGIKDVPAPVLPGHNDTVRVYFDKVRLQLKNDTLYCVGPDKLPEQAKFHRTKNNR